MNYQEFRSDYEMRHRASVPTKPKTVNDYPRWLGFVALVMFIAVSIVSGVHTVSTMRHTMEASKVVAEAAKDIASLAAFFGFEVALFVSVFGWLRRDNRWVAYLATAVVFAVIVLANIQDVARAAGDSLLDGVMVLGLGVGTPLVALFSGKLFVDIYRRGLVTGDANDKKYLAACKRWDKEIDRAWGKHQAETREVHEPVHEPTREPKPRVKLHEVARQVRENGHEALSASEMQAEYGISQGSTTKVRAILSNGHQ